MCCRPYQPTNPNCDGFEARCFCLLYSTSPPARLSHLFRNLGGLSGLLTSPLLQVFVFPRRTHLSCILVPIPRRVASKPPILDSMYFLLLGGGNHLGSNACHSGPALGPTLTQMETTSEMRLSPSPANIQVQ